jgi:hypothetical protein
MTEADEQLAEILARAAGLDLALAECRDDLIAAFLQVQLQRRALGAAQPLAEPWPPMRVESER